MFSKFSEWLSLGNEQERQTLLTELRMKLGTDFNPSFPDGRSLEKGTSQELKKVSEMVNRGLEMFPLFIEEEMQKIEGKSIQRGSELTQVEKQELRDACINMILDDVLRKAISINRSEDRMAEMLKWLRNDIADTLDATLYRLRRSK